MKSTATLAAAVLLVVSGINLAPALAANNSPAVTPAPTQTNAEMADNVSHEAALPASDTQIQGVIAKATDYAMTPKDMDKLVSLFPDAQQKSISKSNTYSQGYGDKLNTQIESISKAWKQKYGNDFALSNSPSVMSQSFASIQAEKPGDNNAKMESATVAIKNASGATKLEVPLVCEKTNDWKINVPASLTADKLRDNLLAQLTEVDKQAAHWPTNETSAYQLVAHHVFAAILDQPMPAHTQAAANPQPAAKVAQQASGANAAVKPVSATSTHHWYQFWDW